MTEEQFLDLAVNAFWDCEGNTREGLKAVVAAFTAKPFSTYPEDRAKMLALADDILKLDDEDSRKAIDLADLVQAILRDEEIK